MTPENTTIRIGLIDDHQLFREGIKSLLSSTFWISFVLEASSEEEFFTQLKTTIPDIILLDLELGDSDGIEIIKKLKISHPDLKIIMLTMHGEDRMISYLMEIGANAYLPKDSNQTELEIAIKSTYEDGVYFSPHVAKIMLKQVQQKEDSIPELNNPYQLTKRELEVLLMISKEHTTPEIAEHFFLSTRTIEGYRKNLMSKLGVKNSAGLIMKAIKENIISI
ncbi:MAG: response regulator [Crocinitomicaceae bacterium]